MAAKNPMTREQLLRECREYAGLYAEVMERSKRLKDQNYTTLVFERNGEYYQLGSGLWGPLEPKRVDRLADDTLSRQELEAACPTT